MEPPRQYTAYADAARRKRYFPGLAYGHFFLAGAIKSTNATKMKHTWVSLSGLVYQQMNLGVLLCGEIFAT